MRELALPRMLRMPSLEQLPPGTRREFAAELFWHYRKAGRPELPRVVNAITALPETPSVSRETVRRLLKGETISRWDKVDALLRVLCSMADRDPDDQRWPDDYDDDITYRDRLRQLWDNDIDGVEPEPESPPAQTSAGGWGAPQSAQPRPGSWPVSQQKAPTDDPWATSAPIRSPAGSSNGKYSDEPPF